MGGTCQKVSNFKKSTYTDNRNCFNLKICLIYCHFRDTFNGGPVHWIHENYVCPNCVKSPNDGCCKNVPEGQFCKSDTMTIEEDPNVNHTASEPNGRFNSMNQHF